MRVSAIAIVLSLLVWLLVGCGASVESRSKQASEHALVLAGSGWVGFAGVGVGMLIDESTYGDAVAVGTRVGSYPDAGLERMEKTAAREAVRCHCTMVYHNAAKTEWLQADPLVYDEGVVTVRIRAWRNGELALDEYQRVPFPL